MNLHNLRELKVHARLFLFAFLCMTMLVNNVIKNWVGEALFFFFSRVVPASHLQESYISVLSLSFFRGDSEIVFCLWSQSLLVSEHHCSTHSCWSIAPLIIALLRTSPPIVGIFHILSSLSTHDLIEVSYLTEGAGFKISYYFLIILHSLVFPTKIKCGESHFCF